MGKKRKKKKNYQDSTIGKILPGITLGFRCNLVEDFKKSLDDIEYNRYGDTSVYSNDYNDDFWDNYYSNLFEGINYSYSKYSKGSNKKTKEKDFNLDNLDNKEKDDLVDNYYNSEKEKEIYYYEDVNKAKCRVFSSLTSFDLFLTQENIDIQDRDIYEMVYSDEIHCCINPVQYNKHGYKEMVVCKSYNELRWEVSDLSLGTCLASEYYIEEEGVSCIDDGEQIIEGLQGILVD